MFNNKTKMFLLLTAIFIAILGVSVASATDLNNYATDSPNIAEEITTQAIPPSVESIKSDVSIKNTQLIKNVKKNVKNEGEGTFTELADDISPSEVTLTKDYVQQDSEGNITINGEKIIDGAGHTITATKGVFTVNTSSILTLKNTIILSEYGPSYSLAYDDIMNKGTLILNNVTFRYTADSRTYGEPIYMNTGSKLTAIDCTFDGADSNRAAVYGYGANIEMDIEGCTFTNINMANSPLYMRAAGNLTLKDSRFINNGPSANYGGALYLNNLNQNVLIDNCLFENNTASYRGGVMYTSGNTTVKNSIMRNNVNAKEMYNAGTIWVNSPNTVLVLENNTMEGNVAKAADVYFNNGKLNSTLKIQGENIVADQESSVTSTFNITDDNGNSIDFRTNPFMMEINDEEIPVSYANGTITATFDASFEPGEYTIKFNYDNSIILKEADIPEFTLTVKDIGLYKYQNVTNAINAARAGATVPINNAIVRGSTEESILINKYVTIDFNGNSIDAKKGKIFDIGEQGVVKIKNLIITNAGNPNANINNTEGRIANVSGGIISFENVTFKDSSAPNFGSSAKGSFILALFEHSFVELKDCTIVNCAGTFINNANATVTIDNTIFENNSASSYDAIIANGGILEINNSQFNNNIINIATIRGQSNTLASSAYGNYYTFGNQPLTISNSKFENNYAGSGRGAAVNTHNDTTITNSVFISNRINQYSNKGGAVFSEAGDLTIDGCVFENNSARYSVSWSGTVTANEGTAIYNQEGNLNIKNSIIISNVTEVSAVYNDASDAEVVANSNYWGTNTPEGFWKSGSSADEITVDNWIILDVTTSPSDNIAFKDNVTVIASLNQVTDGTTVTGINGTLPDYGAVTFSAKGGDLSDATMNLTEGIARTTMNVKLNPITITASYPNEEVAYSSEVTMPEPQIITLNDGNWSAYFNEADGTIKEDVVVPYSELRFEGVFTEKDMEINIPVNITTADTQAVLNNCTILVTADDVNITNIQMNSEDYADVLIELKDVSNVNINKNTLSLTNYEDKSITHAIEINNGKNNVVRENIITTTGPEDNIVYGGQNNDEIKILYTASIESINSDDLIIESNNITTKGNGKEAEIMGTIYGVYVKGLSRKELTKDTQIINNNIDTEVEAYAYAISIANANNMLVENNTITSTGKTYANGIQTYSTNNSVINNNKIISTSENQAYGILSNGEIDWDTYQTYTSENNTISNNMIKLDSRHAWAIELFIGESNAVQYNNITIDADYGVGIGLADSSTNDISYNNINIDAKMEGSSESQDTIQVYTAGIKVGSSGMPMHSAMYNAITFNNVMVTAPTANVPAVNSSSNHNEICYNYLVSPKGIADNAVLDTGNYGTVEDNTPLSYIITDDTYANFFDENSVFKPSAAENGSYLIVSGEINNKDFIFDNVNLVITNDGTSTLYNATITVQNYAKVVLDGVVINNTNKDSDYAILLESEGNIIENSVINSVGEEPIHVIEITENANTIKNTIVNAIMPSAPIAYDKNWVGHPASSAIYISSSDNLLDNVTVMLNDNGEEKGAYSSLDGIDIQSPASGLLAENNVIKNSDINVTGINYTYGINIGRTKNTQMDNTEVTVVSNNYADAIQLFDADTTTLSGKIISYGNTEAYGVYSTAMGSGISQNIDLTGLNMNVESNKATGVLIEGSNNTILADATYDIEGGNVTAFIAYIDWMNNTPSGFIANNITANLNGSGDNNAIYFGKCENVTITNCTIKSTKGSEITFVQTENAQVTDNYIMIDDTIIGDYAVKSDSEDTIIANNTPKSSLIEDLLKQIEEMQKIIDELTAPKETTLVINQITDVQYLDNVVITGKLTDDKGNLMPNKEITITFNNKQTNTVSNENGIFEFNTVVKKLGENSISASFNGTDAYLASEAASTFTVEKKDTNFIIDELENVKYLDKITISGTFINADGKALGNSNIKLTINGETTTVKTDNAGKFSTIYNATLMGENTITAAYSGNAKYNGCTVTSTFTVEKKDTQITIEDIAAAKYNDKIIITGKFTNADGKALINTNVKVTINGVTTTVKTDNKGVFTLNYTAKELGDITVTASYKGNAKYNGCEATTTFRVDKKDTVITVDDIADTTKGKNVTVTGKFTNEDGTALTNSNIVVYVNGAHHTVKTDSTGTYSYTFKAKNIGENYITVAYSGNAKYNTFHTTTTFNVEE